MFSVSLSGTFHTLVFLPIAYTKPQFIAYPQQLPKAELHKPMFSITHTQELLSMVDDAYTDQSPAPCRDPETLHNTKLTDKHLTEDCSWSNLSAFGGQGG